MRGLETVLFLDRRGGRKGKYMNENIYEIIKAFAYGHNPDTVSAVMGISVEDAKSYQKNYAAEIEETREELRKAGYLG